MHHVSWMPDSPPPDVDSATDSESTAPPMVPVSPPGSPDCLKEVEIKGVSRLHAKGDRCDDNATNHQVGGTDPTKTPPTIKSDSPENDTVHDTLLSPTAVTNTNTTNTTTTLLAPPPPAPTATADCPRIMLVGGVGAEGEGEGGGVWANRAWYMSDDGSFDSSANEDQTSNTAFKLCKGHCVVRMRDGCHYWLGGDTPTDCLNTVERWTSSGTATCTVDQVMRCKPMHTPKTAAAAVECGGVLCSIGGFDGYNGLSLCECYDPHHNVWKLLPSLPEALHSLSAAALDGHVYAIGGMSDATSLPVPRVHRLQIHSGGGRDHAGTGIVSTWEQMAPLHHARLGMGVAFLNGSIYIIGGLGGAEGTDVLSSCERYDRDSGRWTEVQSLAVARSHCSVVAFQGRLWVLGGHDGESALRSVECYHPDSDTWTHGPPLPVPRFEHGMWQVDG